MSFWNLKEWFDELIWFGLFNLREAGKALLCRKLLKPYKKTSAEWCLVLNGPSSSNIDKQHLHSSQTIFVNFGFQRQEFKVVDEPFLIIIDQYLIDGTWPADMLLKAIKSNPSCKLVLSYKFYNFISVKFPELIEKTIFIANSKIPTRFNIRHQKPNSYFGFGVGVAEQSISFAIRQGGIKIHIYGLDCNNVILSLSEKKSHIYGSDKAKKWDNPYINARELRFQSYMLDRLRYLSLFCELKKIKLINYSDSLLTRFINKL